MKYLFFDIECANCFEGRGKIYSFGYLLADENLNVIEKEKDIIINPNVEKWDIYVIKNILAYTIKEVNTYPKFTSRYKKIKSLLEDKDTIVCGYSVKDDVGYVLDECYRYQLEPIKINFVDIQRLDKKLSTKKNKGLGEMYMYWCQKLPDGAHRSDIDARFTYEVAKAICREQKKSLKQLIDQDITISGKTDGFKYGFNDEELLSREDRKEKREQQRATKKGYGFRELNDEQKDFILKGYKNDLLFIRFMENVKPQTEREKVLDGKKISISLNFELYNFRNMIKIVQLICDCGGEYVKKASTADIFVKYHLFENGEERRCSKGEHVQEEIKNGKNIQVLEFEEFLALFGLTIEELDNMPDIDCEYLMDEKYKRKKLA